MLAQWSHTWMMSFNPQKCEFLRVTKSCVLTALRTHTNQGSFVCYLSRGYHWQRAHLVFKKLLIKLTKSMPFCTEIYVTTQVVLSAIVTKVLVRLIVEYASPVWDPHTQST